MISARRYRSRRPRIYLPSRHHSGPRNIPGEEVRSLSNWAPLGVETAASDGVQVPDLFGNLVVKGACLYGLCVADQHRIEFSRPTCVGGLLFQISAQTVLPSSS